MSPIIENIDRMVRDVPAMPLVAQKVMHMLGDPRTTNSMLGETLSSDQSLVTRILQMANSPFFGTRQKIASITNAVFILGHSALRSLVITVCTRGLFKNSGLMEDKLWEHSLGSAVTARQIAERTGMQDPAEAFISGLLHDIGRTSLMVVYYKVYHDMFIKAYNDNLSMEAMIALEKEEFGYDHAEIGALVLNKWQFPAVYIRVARRHHCMDEETIAREEEYAAPLAITAQANLLAGRSGMGRCQPDKRIDVISTPYNKILGLDGDDIITIIGKSLKTYKEAREMFDLR